MTAAQPSLYGLRAFEAAARLRSMSAAAAELPVTHGAISRHVRAQFIGFEDIETRFEREWLAIGGTQ